MDGWPTTAAAVLAIQKQCSKFVSRTSKMQLVDPYKLLLPSQEMPHQRKPKKSELIETPIETTAKKQMDAQRTPKKKT